MDRRKFLKGLVALPALGLLSPLFDKVPPARLKTVVKTPFIDHGNGNQLLTPAEIAKEALQCLGMNIGDNFTVGGFNSVRTGRPVIFRVKEIV